MADNTPPAPSDGTGHAILAPDPLPVPQVFPAGPLVPRAIRVVLVGVPIGWVAFFCTDTAATDSGSVSPGRRTDRNSWRPPHACSTSPHDIQEVTPNTVWAERGEPGSESG